MTDRPGPGGPWPLDPQVPPFAQPPATPSYGVPSQPYSPPQPPTYPTQAPSFVPAGQYYQAQPYPGQPYTPPPGTQPPYGSGPGSNEPDRVPVKYGVMAGVAVVLLAVIGVGVVVLSMSSTPKSTAASVWTAVPTATRTASARPSSTPSPSKVGNCSGSSAGTPDWHAVIPAGWSCEYEAGAEVTLINDTYDTIMVQATNTRSASIGCGSDLAREATVTALPDSTWGGKVSKTAKITYRSYDGEARCVYTNGYTYVMVGFVVQGTFEDLVAGEVELTQSWTWSS